jgi:hypothetical protein
LKNADLCLISRRSRICPATDLHGGQIEERRRGDKLDAGGGGAGDVLSGRSVAKGEEHAKIGPRVQRYLRKLPAIIPRGTPTSVMFRLPPRCHARLTP